MQHQYHSMVLFYLKNHYSYQQQQYYPPPPQVDLVQERKDKEEILWQLGKYKRLGVQGVKNFNMSSDLDDMKAELHKIKQQRELEMVGQVYSISRTQFVEFILSVDKAFNTVIYLCSLLFVSCRQDADL